MLYYRIEVRRFYMREKILSLAKGNFIYDTPELVLQGTPLAFSVMAGERESFHFTLANSRGTKIKGFGVAEDVHIDFLPFFEGTDIDLSFEVNAEELIPGEKLQGKLLLVTDCGECEVPYDISIIVPILQDDKGAIQDYYMFQERIEENPEHAADLFFSEQFQNSFLYRDKAGEILYHYLTNKNTKLQAMEEFLVGMRKKDPIRFEVFHESGKQISYELNGVDIQDLLRIKLNTWGHTGIYVSSTADFIVPHTHVLWTDEFVHGQDILEFSILADKVPQGRRFGELILQTPYEKKVIRIDAHNQSGEQERKVERAKKAAWAQMIRMYLAYQGKRITKAKFHAFLKKNREVLEKVGGKYSLAIKGYISIELLGEENILEFLQEVQDVEVPQDGSTVEEVESYITIKYVESLSTGRPEDKLALLHMMDVYEELGYQTTFLTYLRTQLDERYRSVRLLEKDVRAQLEAGSNSPFLYSAMMHTYREDTTLIASLDKVTIATINYGLKRDLITKDISMAFSFLAERLPGFNPIVFSNLQQLYDFFIMGETLRAICGMLIRNEIRLKKHFVWFEKGVAKNLRLTDLFEYYMYTMDFEKVTNLPNSVLSYFQYENHLNDTCKAFLFSFIVLHRNEQPEIYRVYREQIREFAYRQLMRHRISPYLAPIYEFVFEKDKIEGEVALQLPYVMFTHGIWCDNEQMQGVVVVHKECQGETYYALDNGYTQVQIYTPNAQIYFVDNQGHYYSESVDYRIERLLELHEYALKCYEEGAECSPLFIYLAVKAERAARITEQQAQILHFVMKKRILREAMQQKVMLRLYDYYCEIKEVPLVLEMLDCLEPDTLKRERLGDVASACIYQGMYEKATKMLCRGGIEQCEQNALSMLVADLIQKNEGEFEPLLAKWALHLYRNKCYEKAHMEYLLHYYMGDVRTLTAIYQKCQQMPEVVIGEDANERLLAQVVFVGEDLSLYESLYQDYYQNGDNRMLAKAFLAQCAYEYVVEQTDLSEAMFVKIEKEALYEKDLVMVLAALRYYREQPNFTGKQKEFVELNLEKYAGEGIVLAFMKDYIGKVNVPHEIENTVLIQYYSGSNQDVFLLEETADGKTESYPMRQVFPGVFTRELLLFGNEEKRCCIYEEETGEKTEYMSVKRTGQQKGMPGFFQMVNQMMDAKHDNDEETYRELRKEYEKARHAAKRLFELH